MAITQEKMREIMMAFLMFCLLQQNIGIELHIIYMLKQFPLQLGNAGAAS